jgi:hypothetical protein
MEWSKHASFLEQLIQVRAYESSHWKARLGLICEQKQTVHINGSCTEPLQRMVAVHELTHAIDTFFALHLSETMTSAVASVMHELLVRSPGVVRWLSGAHAADSMSMTLNLFSARFAVVFEDTALWSGPCVRVSYREGLVTVEREAGEQEQRADFMMSVLEAGLATLRAELQPIERGALAEGWLSMIRNSPGMVSWWALGSTEARDGTQTRDD